MTKSKPKLVLSNTRLIPFNKLVLSQANVRRVSNGVSIENLAEDIAHRGLLHNLNVRPVLDEAGAETGDRPRFRLVGGAIARWKFWSSRSACRRPPRSPQRQERRRSDLGGRGLPRGEHLPRSAASARRIPRHPGAFGEGPRR